MSLEFLRDEPEVAFRQTLSALHEMNPKIQPGVFESMSIEQIDTLLDRLSRREHKIIAESPYGSWVQDPAFMQIKMLQDGLLNLREHIEVLVESEVLVPGFTYYTDVRQFGSHIEGKSCTFLGEGRPSNWVGFTDVVPIMKALELMKHGDVNDFRRIYVEMANGRPDGLDRVSVEHITESTDAALYEMEAYCDARWEGPWPWETQAPYKISRIIEEYNMQRQQTLYEMHQTLSQMLREYDDGNQEQFNIISSTRTMSDTVQKMIEQFAKLAGEALINLKAQALTNLGDEAAMKVEHGLTQSVNQCADALAHLKVNIDTLVQELSNHQSGGLDQMGGMGGPDMGGEPGMDDGSGMPPDASAGGEPPMGAEDGAPPPSGGAAPPPPGAIPPERPRKAS